MKVVTSSFYLIVFVFSIFTSNAFASGGRCSSYDLTGLKAIAGGTESANTPKVSASNNDEAKQKLQQYIYPTTKVAEDSLSNKYVFWCRIADDKLVLRYGSGLGYYYNISVGFSAYDKKPIQPPEPCETPKTDAECNIGSVGFVTGNQAFWDSGNYKGCTFESTGIGVTDSSGNKSQDIKSTGSTGQAWCSASDSTYNPVDDAALAANPDLKPALDNKPSNCPNGWVQAGGSKYYCVENGSVDAPPDKVNPDGSINSDKDGNPQPPDANVGKPPTEGDGDGSTGGGGTGGGGVSKADIKEAVQHGVEDALGKKAGSPAPFVPPAVESVDGGINGVMTRYKQRINASPVILAANNLRFSAPSSGCTPWSVHLDFLDQAVSFDQCNFLITHAEKVGYLMLAAYAIAALIIFLKA